MTGTNTTWGSTGLRRTMLFWTFFQGFGALLGGTMGMLSPLGSWFGGESMVPQLQVLPFADVLFQNLFVPAMLLAVVIGVGDLTAAFLILRHSRAGAWIACLEGLVISTFTAVEFVVLGSNPLSDVYFFLGIAQFVCGLLFLRSIPAEA